MKAVNLVPLESRRGRGAPSRSGGLVYALLGGLGLLCVVGGMYGLSARTVKERQATLADLKAQTSDAEAQAQRLAPYARFSKVAQEREATVAAVTERRFAWGVALRELARVTPADVELLSISGGRGTSSGSSQQAPPAQFELTGCARSQSDVSRLMARLRAVNKVVRVKLTSSTKLEAEATSSESSDGQGECRTKASDAQFAVVIFFASVGASPNAAAPISAPADPKVAAPAAAAPAETPPSAVPTPAAAAASNPSAAPSATTDGAQAPSTNPPTPPGT